MCFVWKLGAVNHVYTRWGTNECDKGEVLEYEGLILSTHYAHSKGDWLCFSKEMDTIELTSSTNHDGHLL